MNKDEDTQQHDEEERTFDRQNSIRGKSNGDWVEYIDEANDNAPFWYNSKTGVSTWDKPEEFDNTIYETPASKGNGGNKKNGFGGLEDFLLENATQVDTPENIDTPASLKTTGGGNNAVVIEVEGELECDIGC